MCSLVPDGRFTFWINRIRTSLNEADHCNVYCGSKLMWIKIADSKHYTSECFYVRLTSSMPPTNQGCLSVSRDLTSGARLPMSLKADGCWSIGFLNCAGSGFHSLMIHWWLELVTEFTWSTQPSIPPGRLIEYRPVWLWLRRGVFTCVRWQVTLCDLIWQVTSRGCEMEFHLL